MSEGLTKAERNMMRKKCNDYLNYLSRCKEHNGYTDLTCIACGYVFISDYGIIRGSGDEVCPECKFDNYIEPVQVDAKQLLNMLEMIDDSEKRQIITINALNQVVKHDSWKTNDDDEKQIAQRALDQLK